MAIIYAVTNQKGGVGKTTTSVNLAASLAATKKKVLLIDSDPQGNATMGSGVDKNGLELSVYDVLMGLASVAEAAFKPDEVGFTTLGANGDLTAAEVQLLKQKNKEFRLKKALQLVDSQYDYILIDAPPSLGMLTLNTLAAADSVLIPIQCEFYALEGLSQLLNTVRIVQKNLNPALQIEGVLLTMFDSRLNLSKQVAEEAKEYFGPRVFRTNIPRNVRIAEAPSFGEPIVMYDIMSVGAKSYLALAQEVIERTSARPAEAGITLASAGGES